MFNFFRLNSSASLLCYLNILEQRNRDRETNLPEADKRKHNYFRKDSGIRRLISVFIY